MDLTNKAATPRVTLVHVRDPRVPWCVRASQVIRIIVAAEWSATPPRDTVVLLGAAPSAPAAARRIVVVRGAGNAEVALLAAGPIDVSDVDPDSVLALPAAFAASAPHVAGIIVAPDASLSLLLEPSVVTTPEDSVFGEELCPRRS